MVQSSVKIIKKTVFGIVLLMVFLSNIKADESPLRPAEFRSLNNQYKLIPKDATGEPLLMMIENWELIRIDTNELLYNFVWYRLSTVFLEQEIFISNSGKSIILVNWSFANWYDISTNEKNMKDTNVLTFYYLGKEIKNYKLSDVFNDIEKLKRRGMYHFYWTENNFIKMDNDQIKIRTTESYEYIFNAKNGKITNKRKI